MGIRELFGNSKKSGDEVKDLVCGMKVNLAKTEYKSTYKGKEYGFCSPSCKETFEGNPEKFVK